MPTDLPNLGELEIQVMRLVWGHEPCTERQISDVIQEDRSVARTTVLKTMQRLEAKGLLKRVAGESPVQFRAVHKQKKVLPELVRRFVERVLGGSSNPLVAYLAESEDLSARDVQSLQKIAKKIREAEEAETTGDRPMSGFIESLNAFSGDGLERLWTVLWQWTLIAVVAGIGILYLRRAQPAVRFWLWNLLLLKLLVMPFWMIAVETAAPASATRDSQPQSKNRSDSSSHRDAVSTDRARIGRAESNVVTGAGSKTGQDTASGSPAVSLPRLSWTSLLLAIWLLLVVGQLVRTLSQRVRLRRFLRLAQPGTAELESRVHVVAEEIGVGRLPRLLISPDECSPFVCGLRQPVLVLPASLPGALSDAAFRQVVLHELAHLKRRDLLWCWPSEIVRMLFWFHPLVHWICRRIHLERELACDQVAMVHSGGSAGSYAQTLVDVVTQSGVGQPRAGRGGSANLLTVHP